MYFSRKHDKMSQFLTIRPGNDLHRWSIPPEVQSDHPLCAGPMEYWAE